VLTIPDGADRFASNTADDSQRVGLTTLAGATVDGDVLTFTLPPLSWGWVLVDASAR
jgi:alpha-N-arabinofuranosidase